MKELWQAVIVVLTAIVILATSVAFSQPVVVSTNAPVMSDLNVTATAMLIVDKKMLREILREAKELGTSVNIAIYEYNEKKDVWDRARVWCNENREEMQ